MFPTRLNTAIAEDLNIIQECSGTGNEIVHKFESNIQTIVSVRLAIIVDPYSIHRIVQNIF